MKNSYNKKGGFNLIYKPTEFKPYKIRLYDTLNDPLNKMTILTHNSLGGILISVKINGIKYFEDALGKPIDNLLLKIGFVRKKADVIDYQKMNQYLHKKECVTRETFQKEIQLHQEIYQKSMSKYGYSIVPSVQYETMLNIDKDALKMILSKLKPEDKDIFSLYIRGLRRFNRDKRNPAELVGYTMRTMDNYETLDKVLTESVNETVTKVALLLYQIYQILFVGLGYVHGDAHSSNILLQYKRDEATRNTQLTGFATIIDFGRIVTLKPRKVPANVTDIVNIRYAIEIIYRYCDVVRRQYRMSDDKLPCIGLGRWNSLSDEDIRNIQTGIQFQLRNFKEISKQRNLFAECIEQSKSNCMTRVRDASTRRSTMDIEDEETGGAFRGGRKYRKKSKKHNKTRKNSKKQKNKRKNNKKSKMTRKK